MQTGERVGIDIVLSKKKEYVGGRTANNTLGLN